MTRLVQPDPSTRQEPALDVLKARRAHVASALGDDTDSFEGDLDLPDPGLAGEVLVERVLPMQADEFTCSACYLVQHRSRLADDTLIICTDCAA